MKLRLDENFGRRGLTACEAAGHDVETVAAEKMCGASDKDLIAVCKAEGRCLITLDLDFANPFVYPPEDLPGVAVVRLSGSGSPDELLTALHRLLNGLEANAIEGKLWIVSNKRLREYLPDD